MKRREFLQALLGTTTLLALSAASNNLPVPVPDFTNGIWQTKRSLETIWTLTI
ncbi:MAG: hypothetical protein AAGJ82_14305 [Bacteroidota bacterium]